MFGRQKHVETPEEDVEPVAPSVRANGPWDSSEKDIGDDSAYLDFGSLLIRGRLGFNLQMPTDDDQGTIGSIVLVTEDAGLELRAFADARSGGLWDAVRADLEAEAERLEGEAESLEGPFGTELHVKVPVKRLTARRASSPPASSASRDHGGCCARRSSAMRPLEPRRRRPADAGVARRRGRAGRRSSRTSRPVAPHHR